jgi:hypothetical protein
MDEAFSLSCRVGLEPCFDTFIFTTPFYLSTVVFLSSICYGMEKGNCSSWYCQSCVLPLISLFFLLSFGLQKIKMIFYGSLFSSFFFLVGLITFTVNKK